MNRLFNVLLLGGVFAVNPAPSHAQIPVENELNMVDEYLVDLTQDHSNAWWNALGRQLALTVDKPHEEVAEASLQNIIYFATHHSDRIKLEDANPKLLAVYRSHNDAGMRALTLAAIHAIGSEAAIADAYALSTRDRSPLARHIGKAAKAESTAKRTQ